MRRKNKKGRKKTKMSGRKKRGRNRKILQERTSSMLQTFIV